MSTPSMRYLECNCGGRRRAFLDGAHFSAGVVPGDGIFTAWSFRAGAGRAEAFRANNPTGSEGEGRYLKGVRWGASRNPQK
jgi:hypothetical protein